MNNTNSILKADNNIPILNQPKLDTSNKNIEPKIETINVNKTILNANNNVTNEKAVNTVLPDLDKTNIIGTTVENGSNQLVLDDSALNDAVSLGNFDMNLLND